MTIYKLDDVSPSLSEGVFIADSADVVGNVSVGENANLWFGVVARGDVNSITVGENTNIQDLTMLHVTEDLPLVVGRNVSVGHGAILHACIIEDSCLIGMGAIILDGAHISKNSVVAGGSVVPPGKKYPENSMIMGNPAKVVRELRADEIEKYSNHYKSYIKTKNDYLSGLKEI
jgi:carbonic anhydrase/acetyltransferase-like protein (isoleucine patch superfamily)